jgi:RND family efflux transporter MFP subunit
MRKLRVLFVLALLVVGIGAVVVAVGGVPFSSSASSSQYITTAVSRQTVTQSAAATGNVSAATTYSLTFGAAAQSGTGSASSSASSNASNASPTWPVTAVDVKVGDNVKIGQVLATADPTNAKLQLQVAQANLEAAQSKLATDRTGPDATTKAAAHQSVTQATTQLSQARQSYADTVRQNSISLAQAQAAVKNAKSQLATDTSGGASAQVIAADKNAVTQSEQNLASTQARVSASNHSASNQITNAQNQVTSAKANYAKAIAPAAANQIATDQSAVASAQSALATATTAVANASISAPVAGVITAVNVTVGANAPSGAAITLASANLQVAAQFAETDLPSLKVGQPASVTIKAVSATAVAGTIVAIAPQAASSSGGVVSYTVTVSLTTPPAGILIGMSAQVSITLAQSADVLTIPTTALSGQQGSYAVRVVDAGGQVRSVTVQIGLVTNSLAEVTSGLTEGQLVVTGTASTRTGTTTGGGLGGGLPGLGGGGGGGRFNGGGVNP